jgi:hypothetical protein
VYKASVRTGPAAADSRAGPRPARSNQDPGMMKKLYAVTAILVLNTVLLFVAANLIAGLFLDEPDDGPIVYPTQALVDSYGFDLLKQNYPGWKEADLRVLLNESSNWLLEYEPFTQFRPTTRSDRYITIHAAGFRVSPPQGPWPPAADAFNLFVFGSSGTMGAGLPDESTIPTRLQARLHTDCSARVNVYNFGRGLYFSTQERILFEQLLLSGIVPNMAVFFDGMTDFYFPTGTPHLTARLHAFMEQANQARLPETPEKVDFGGKFVRLLEALPAYRLWQSYGPELLAPAHAAEFQPPPGQSAAARIVVERWRANRRMIQAIAASFEVPLLFAWGPGAVYGYDLDHMNVSIAGKLNFGRHTLSATGFRQMAELHESGQLGEDFLWLGDLHHGIEANLYVDAVHYDEAFSHIIADAVFDRLVAQYPFVCNR